MAANTVSALAAIAPVAPRNGAPQGSSAQTGQPDQPSFSQVLKSRTQAAEKAPKPTESKPSSKAEGLPDKASAQAPGKQEETADDSTSPLPGDAAKLALLLGDAHATQAESDSDEIGTEDETLATDPSLALLSDQPAAAIPLQDPASAAAALAAAAANLAGQGAAQSGSNGSPIGSEESRKGLADTTGVTDTRRGAEGKDLPAGAGISERASADNVEFNPAATAARASDQGSDRSNSFASELTLAQNQATQASQSSQTHPGLQAARPNEVVPRHEVSTPVATRGWADEVGQKISWVATQDKGRAELVLNPPQMGRIEVSINLNGDQASASFVAASPIAREALQDALPRLREVLADAGIQLGQANVNAGNSGQQTQGDTPSQRSAGGSYGQRDAASLEPLVAASHANWARSGSGMIDTFA